MISQKDIDQLIQVSKSISFDVKKEDIFLVTWEAGEKSHIPTPLPKKMAAVYIFKWNDFYLKVGKVNSNSSARYQSQHYNENSSSSNLAKSLLSDEYFHSIVDCDNINFWLRRNTTRFNVLIPESYGKKFIHFVEAFFILKCDPKFENSRN